MPKGYENSPGEHAKKSESSMVATTEGDPFKKKTAILNNLQSFFTLKHSFKS